MRHWLWAALAAWFVVGAMGHAAAAPRLACPPSKVPPLTLPGVKQALANNREVFIVALGSSSTEGSQASDIAHSYPAVLQRTLAAALPAAHVAVLNRGIGGQDVSEELPRITSEIIGARPTLVIWQVGANSAMRHMQPDHFKAMVAAGVNRLKASGIDVVLMDNQRAPAIIASPEHVRIDQALADVSVTAGAGLFRRGALMEQWRNENRPYADFIANDGIHHNDLGYRCVAESLAQAILDGVAPRTPPTHAEASSR